MPTTGQNDAAKSAMKPFAYPTGQNAEDTLWVKLSATCQRNGHSLRQQGSIHTGITILGC